LRYDEDCGWYAVKNPRWAFVFQVAVLSLILPLPLLFLSASVVKPAAIHVVAIRFISFGLLLFWGLLMVLHVRHWRCGYGVALTTEGLVMRLAAMRLEFIPWTRVRKMEVRRFYGAGYHLIRLLLRDPARRVDLNKGPFRMFKTMAELDLFVERVEILRTRAEARTGANDPSLVDTESKSTAK
jgi:hypothetical protein